jgi:hypothetical protein
VTTPALPALNPHSCLASSWSTLRTQTRCWCRC